MRLEFDDSADGMKKMVEEMQNVVDEKEIMEKATSNPVFDKKDDVDPFDSRSVSKAS